MARGDKPHTTAAALKDGWVYEDTLPANISKRLYDWWYEESLVIDGVRMGPPLFAPPSEVAGGEREAVVGIKPLVWNEAGKQFWAESPLSTEDGAILTWSLHEAGGNWYLNESYQEAVIVSSIDEGKRLAEKHWREYIGTALTAQPQAGEREAVLREIKEAVLSLHVFDRTGAQVQTDALAAIDRLATTPNRTAGDDPLKGE
jgi:hypothetical protein